AGVEITGPGARNNLVAGNFIGTNASGTVSLGNTIGVLVDQGASGNLIGGTTAAARNVISGNTGDGVRISASGTSGNGVEGNYIGTSATGSAALGSLGNGLSVQIGASNNIVGGTAAGARNIISGNAGDGIHLLDGYVFAGNYITRNTAHNLFEGNYIGT